MILGITSGMKPLGHMDTEKLRLIFSPLAREEAMRLLVYAYNHRLSAANAPFDLPDNADDAAIQSLCCAGWLEEGAGREHGNRPQYRLAYDGYMLGLLLLARLIAMI